ncbi:hypothetical protein SAMN04490248_10196 [Salinihabitans flavidus]|uniref:CWH43-like N-terminal domain-containing protein n=1 Tax=Salinihabitans flavidus TaxID=569882 RepID=A0A1H8LDB6_9RHOB|nr:hypothetical protein [Salinihabitans flavidus]SEO03162.1 hypothetical protein SAMN04490248_10196 [Salinihabitans flavidus]
MTETSPGSVQCATARPHVAEAGLAIWVLTSVGFVVAVINLLIYRARWDFIAAHPVYSAGQPPTISRALSDPAIGEPFAFWMLLAAPLLVLGLCAILALVEMDLRRFGAGQVNLARVRALFVLIVLLQTVAAVGIVMLSHYRMPEATPRHMTGSYLFFIAQTGTVLAGGIVSGWLRALPEGPGRLTLARMHEFRRRMAAVPLLLAALYLVLFVAKHFTFPVGNEAVYLAYVSTEPVVITAMLLYLALFAVDTGVIVLRYFRA